MECTRAWIEKVHSLDKRLTSGMIIADTLWRAGASQIHPHLQVWLGGQYEGQFAVLERQSVLYRQQHGTSFISDMVYLHLKLGLAVTVGDVVVMAPLTSHKEYELMVISPTVDDTFTQVYANIMKVYNEDLSLYCRSMAMSWPSLDTSGGKVDTLPAILRMGSRGACDSGINDVSSLELYSVYSVSVDPYTTINMFKHVVNI